MRRRLAAPCSAGPPPPAAPQVGAYWSVKHPPLTQVVDGRHAATHTHGSPADRASGTEALALGQPPAAVDSHIVLLEVLDRWWLGLSDHFAEHLPCCMGALGPLRYPLGPCVCVDAPLSSSDV